MLVHKQHQYIIHKLFTQKREYTIHKLARIKLHGKNQKNSVKAKIKDKTKERKVTTHNKTNIYT